METRMTFTLCIATITNANESFDTFNCDWFYGHTSASRANRNRVILWYFIIVTITINCLNEHVRLYTLLHASFVSDTMWYLNVSRSLCCFVNFSNGAVWMSVDNFLRDTVSSVSFQFINNVCSKTFTSWFTIVWYLLCGARWCEKWVKK